MIVQRYISNPLLYNSHKLEFRIYFLISSTDPLIVYAQNKAHIKKCGLPYDKFDTRKDTHVCNTAIQKNKISNLDGNEDKNEYIIDWNLEYLEEYLKL
jgi:hypothetical protein